MKKIMMPELKAGYVVEIEDSTSGAISHASITYNDRDVLCMSSENYYCDVRDIPADGVRIYSKITKVYGRCHWNDTAYKVDAEARELLWTCEDVEKEYKYIFSNEKYVEAEGVDSLFSNHGWISKIQGKEFDVSEKTFIGTGYCGKIEWCEKVEV